MSAEYKFDFSDLEKLEEKLMQIPTNTEKIINSVLHKTGVKVAVDKITNRMPVSRPKRQRLSKRHAKHSKWSKHEKGNLEFTIKAKGGAANRPGSFGYLVFPNDGRGPYNRVAQNFFEEGMDDGTPEILNDLYEKIEKSLKEDLI